MRILDVVRNSMNLLLFSVLFLTACTNSGVENRPSIHQADTQVPNIDTGSFQPYKHHLFTTSNGRLAYKTLDNSEPSKPEDRFLTSINTDTLNNEQKEELSQVLDTASFVHVGDLYYKDKKHVYYHHQRMDGGTFFIVWEADPKSFHVLDSSYYAKDSRCVFSRGGLLKGADSKTFRVVAQTNKEVYQWTAKDKHHNYKGAEIINDEEL